MRAPDTLPPHMIRDLEAMDAAVAGAPHPGGDPLLAELAALVAEVRPALDPEAARTLDVRAASGFAAAQRRRQRLAKLRSPRAALAPAVGLVACALLALAIALAGTGAHDNTVSTIGAGSSGAGSASSGGGASDSAGRMSGESSGGSSVGPELQPAPGVPPVAPGGDPRSDGRMARKVERSATMTLGAPAREVDAVASGAARVATTLGGFVASSSIDSRSGGQLELRVPAARLDEAVDRLSRLARVRSLQRASLDITATAVSANARVAELGAERRGLLRQLAAATTTDETARIRARLHTVSRRLDQARAQGRRVENRAAYADLGVTIVRERRADASPGWTPRDALHDALKVLEYAAGIALVAFAVALPLVLIGAPAWLTRRHLTRRRRERALDAV